MEYDRQTESLIFWENVVREWLYLDGTVRFELLEDYPELFIPIKNASISAVTYYMDIIAVTEIWNKPQSEELKKRVEATSPGLKRAIKGLATMVADDKAFEESKL